MAKRVAKKNPAAPTPAPPAAPELELWTAERVARDLGVALELVTELQFTALVLGTDLVLVRGILIYTEQGRETMRRAIETRMLAEKKPLAATVLATGTPPAGPAPIEEDLTITRVFPWSTRLLANRANGLEVVLQVRTQKHLAAGMLLSGCVCGEMCWFYYGRLPRASGEAQLFYPKPSKPEGAPTDESPAV